ncbi:MAG: glycosyltransferase [bacterium]
MPTIRIGLCLLVKNELNGCLVDIPNLPLDEFDEVFAVDAGSQDGTQEFLLSQGITVYQQPQKGLNAAYHHAVNCSECDAIVVFFPKGTLSVESLKKFRSLLEDGNKLVVASRQIRGSINEEDASLWRPRKWMVWWLSLFAALLWKKEGYWVRDVLHGYKGFYCEAFRKMDISKEGLSVDVEMVINSYKLQLRRCEFPVEEIPRLHGKSNFPFWKTGKQLFKYIVKELIHY